MRQLGFVKVWGLDFRSWPSLPVPGLNATCDGNPTRVSNLDTIRKNCDEDLRCKLQCPKNSFCLYLDEDASCIYFVWNAAMNEARLCSGTAPDFQAAALFSLRDKLR